jgi:tetratricopeptide (TPR) repeat protein
MDAHGAAALLSWAEEQGPGLRGPEAKAVQGQLEARRGELRAALDWFAAAARVDEGLRLCSALIPFWMAAKRMAEGRAWLDRALALPGGDEGRRARGLHDAGYLAFFLGDVDRSAALYHQAVELGRRTRNATATALALVGLARIALRKVDTDEARRLCRQALAETEGTDDRTGRSSAMHVLAVAAQMAGDFEEARDLMRQRIALGRETGNLAVVSSEAGNLSMVERQMGNLDEAEALAREALEIDVQRGDEWSKPYKVMGLAAVETDRGNHERAARLVGAAEAMVAAQHADWPPDEQVQYDRLLRALPAAMGAEAFERARAAGKALTVEAAVAYALGSG